MSGHLFNKRGSEYAARPSYRTNAESGKLKSDGANAKVDTVRSNVMSRGSLGTGSVLSMNKTILGGLMGANDPHWVATHRNNLSGNKGGLSENGSSKLGSSNSGVKSPDVYSASGNNTGSNSKRQIGGAGFGISPQSFNLKAT